MSRNIMTITKWVPLQNEENNNVFIECNQLKISTKELLQLLGKLLNDFQLKSGWKLYHGISENELLIEKLEIISDMTQKLIQGFTGAFEKLYIDRPSLSQVKVQLWKKILWMIKLKLCYFLQQLITEIAFLYVLYGEKLLILTLRAITKHMSPPGDAINSKIRKNENSDIKESDSFASMEELITYEEQNVLDLLDVAIRIAPSMLGYDSIKKSKDSGATKISNKAKTKVLNYYQQILWGEVGNFLEHIILWWGALPLAARLPHSSQHLREWITQFLPTIEIPTFILSALTNLADALGMHVTSTSWDHYFRLVLVTSKTSYNQDSGRLFCELLQNLVLLCNQCEITSDWILGAPLDELPLVEQIPVLHRLDHSIHTTRLWAINETKRLANNWNADSFFMITHCDIINCLTQLRDLKLADHSAQIEKGGLSAHVEVCANMRAKLVSEVIANHQKLKDTPKQCIDILASVCRMVSLANLQMIFPENQYYKRTDKVTDKPSSYVDKYLDEILTPILAATDDHQISNMILKIMCESWLDHIYIHKIKFSDYGAYQLLTDFESVGTWLIKCPIVNQQMRKKMLKNEVLRRCQGVGKLLLRSPGEYLKMNEKTKYNESESPKSDDTELMPPEMYVPNQEQWLELRAHRKSMFSSSLCCGNTNV